RYHRARNVLMRRLVLACTLTACYVPISNFTTRDGAADGPPAMSCVGLSDTCGPAGTSPCCDSPLVPGGMFYRGYDVGTDNAHPDMMNPAMVTTFRLDTYEVTVGRFRRFAAAGGSDQRAYPWSSPASSLTIDCSYANYEPADFCVKPGTGAVNRVGSESPNGDGKWGQADLGGNVYEWTLDSHASAYGNPCS